MGAVLGLLSALCYGASDFVGGAAGRRVSASLVAMLAQPLGLVAAVIALGIFGTGSGPTTHALVWGAVSGVGSGVGTVTLYAGLAASRMGVVSPISALGTAVIPAIVGMAQGERPSTIALAGLALALPAIILVSLHHDREAASSTSSTASGVAYGLAAGAGFALLFIALDQAGTASSAWPLVPGQAVSSLVIIPFALAWTPRPLGIRAALPAALLAGSLGGVANLLFLAATGRGALTVVAVLTSLYPAVTVLLARFLLHERWQRWQIVGLVASGVAVVLISTG